MVTKRYVAGILLMGIFSIFLYYNTYGQATNAAITGRILDESGEGLPGASVIIRNTATGFTTGTISHPNGDFQFRQLPLGGPYTVSATFIGYGEKKKTGYMVNQGDRIRIDLQLAQNTTQLEEVVVSAQGLSARVEKMGGVTAISSQQIKNLPTEGRNFTRLTSLSPLQGGGSINLGGQRRTSTNVTVDGVNARNQLTAGEIGRGPYTISQEAIREFEVSTNDYDVTQGRQGGGAINAVTKSGSNHVEGSIFFYHRADALQSDLNIRGESRTADFYNSQYGFSVGGPIIKDKLHFYAVYERQDAGEPVGIADIINEEDENRIGITQENLDRFLQIARSKYGVSDDRQVGEFDRETTANTFFLRLDWQINDKHRLTLRNNWNKWDNPFSVSDNSNIELAESWSDFSSEENSTLISLRSAFTPAFTNELKLQYQHAERAFVPSGQLPGSNIPRAIVFVRSDLPNGRNRNITVQLGGQRFTPETNRENQLHFTNTSYLSTGKFNFTFGTDNMITFLETLLSNEQNGRFFFNTLDDFDNMTPNRYAREVPLRGLPVVNQTVVDLSLFGQVAFNPHPDLTTVFGLRWDATIFNDAADFNQTVFDELGIRTDEKPSDWDNIQPRFQLTWNVKGRDTDILKLGGGFFSAQPHYYAQVNNIQNSGVLLGAIDVSGDAVPFPDFVAYRQDPSSVPGIPPGEQPFSTINAVSPDFEVPTVMKANINYTRFFGDRFTLGVNALISRTINNYVYQEANLVDDPYFVVPGEGRPVFVPAETISDNGIVDWTNSRKSDQVGRTLVLTSDGNLNQMALILEGTARLGEDGYLSASYTFNRARDNSSYNCCVANTSTFLPVEGDPRSLNDGFSDNHFSNKVVLNGATPGWKGFVLGLTVVGTGGTRFSLHVDDNTSANGDFNLRNDIAYIFDPNDPETPTEISEGYNEILSDPDTPNNFKDYLRESFGGFAERNGGKNPFAATIDLRLVKRFNFLNSKHGLELSADLFNFANLLNRDWGNDNNFGRRRDFMRITGFDQVTQRYSYNVQTGAGAEPIGGIPWRLQLGARYTFN